MPTTDKYNPFRHVANKGALANKEAHRQSNVVVTLPTLALYDHAKVVYKPSEQKLLVAGALNHETTDGEKR